MTTKLGSTLVEVAESFLVDEEGKMFSDLDLGAFRAALLQDLFFGVTIIHQSEKDEIGPLARDLIDSPEGGQMELCSNFFTMTSILS